MESCIASSLRLKSPYRQVSIELIKLLLKPSIESYKNCFLNMAVPLMVRRELGDAKHSRASKTAANSLPTTLRLAHRFSASRRLPRSR